MREIIRDYMRQSYVSRLRYQTEGNYKARLTLHYSMRVCSQQWNLWLTLSVMHDIDWLHTVRPICIGGTCSSLKLEILKTR